MIAGNLVVAANTHILWQCCTVVPLSNTVSYYVQPVFQPTFEQLGYCVCEKEVKDIQLYAFMTLM